MLLLRPTRQTFLFLHLETNMGPDLSHAAFGAPFASFLDGNPDATGASVLLLAAPPHPATIANPLASMIVASLLAHGCLGGGRVPSALVLPPVLLGPVDCCNSCTEYVFLTASAFLG